MKTLKIFRKQRMYIVEIFSQSYISFKQFNTINDLLNELKVYSDQLDQNKMEVSEDLLEVVTNWYALCSIHLHQKLPE